MKHISLMALSVASIALSGCATPANEVKIPTMPMESAYAASQEAQAASRQAPESRIVRAVISPGRPSPLVTAPVVKLAYSYEWTDTEGNMHYPQWLAIQVDTFKWVMPDVGPVPMDGSAGRPPLAKSGDIYEK
jgi:hypothetical protein